MLVLYLKKSYIYLNHCERMLYKLKLCLYSCSFLVEDYTFQYTNYSVGIQQDNQLCFWISCAVASNFCSGKIISFEVVDGGMICSSGVCLEAMGDKNDDCYIVNAAVYVGY